MSRTTATRTFVSQLELWGDGDGLVHYVVPPLTYVTDEQGRVFAATSDHVFGYRRPQGIQLRVTGAIACDYCTAMRRIAAGEVVES